VTGDVEHATAKDGREDVREEVRRFVEAQWALDITVREWWRRLAEAGLAMPSWPRPFGRAYPGSLARVVTEELAAYGVIAPPQGHLAVPLAAPTILEHGTGEQQARYLPPILRGEEAWCQLFSEPGAGSDLASLATRAVLDGREWVVNGQKVWNSGADVADRAMLLARTDVDVPKHEGITYFLLDMDQPGVEVRPLRQMNGDARFCEVFLTDARVSTADVLGGPGQGWRIARTTLRHERASFAGRGPRGLVTVPSGSKAGFLDRSTGEAIDIYGEGRSSRSGGRARGARRFDGNAIPPLDLVEIARERGVERDPHVRQLLARYYSLTQVNRFTQMRIRAAAAARRPLGPEGAISKLAMSRICHTSREVSFAILGASTMLADHDAPFGGDLQRVGLASFGTSIGGGTDEVQRNNVAEQTLGLPRDPGLDRGVPYRDLLVGTQASPPGPTRSSER
jgi:alkylation response protein AidB-like acyl-CoA dehydrogenase